MYWASKKQSAAPIVRDAAVELLHKMIPCIICRQFGAQLIQNTSDAGAFVTKSGTVPFAGGLLRSRSNPRMNCAAAFVLIPENPNSRPAPDLTTIDAASPVDRALL